MVFIPGGVGFLGDEIAVLMGNGLASSVNHFMGDTLLSISTFLKFPETITNISDE